MDLTRLIAFSASFFLVALSPGLCMTLAMSLGISIGARRTLWMMAGELSGIALVGACAVLGVAALLLKAPTVFAAFKWIGAAYLLYMGWQTWRAEPLGARKTMGTWSWPPDICRSLAASVDDDSLPSAAASASTAPGGRRCGSSVRCASGMPRTVSPFRSA